MAGSAAVVLVETEIDDLFEGASYSVGSLAGSDPVMDTQQFVRRPMRGLMLKREVFATMSVSGPGASASILNSSAPEAVPVNFTSNFILQAVNETRAEKFQPITTFGAPYGFFFGEQPRMINCQATLLNTADFQWEIEWWENYDKYFRGTQLTNRGARVYLSYDDVVLEGYLTQAGTSKNSQNPGQVSLSFSMWVTNVNYLVTAGSTKVAPHHLDVMSDTASMEWTSIDGDGETGKDYVSVLDEVRAANISALAGDSGDGLLSALRNGLESVSDFVGSVGNAIDNALDFLYGRNMVIPAGVAGSEQTSGVATFASGSGFERLATVDFGQLTDGKSINIKVPGSITGSSYSGREAQEFYKNIDEYPYWGGLKQDEARIESQMREVFGEAANEDYQTYEELAKATFSEFGYDITNETGEASSDLVRAIGRASYAAMSYAAMTTGASQTAASLTIIGGTTGNTNAAEQQAAAEELNS